MMSTSFEEYNIMPHGSSESGSTKSLEKVRQIFVDFLSESNSTPEPHMYLGMHRIDAVVLYKYLWNCRCPVVFRQSFWC